jgi:hypothetical protein
MAIVHEITQEDVCVSCREEENGAIRVIFIGGTNEENRQASKLALQWALANGARHAVRRNASKRRKGTRATHGRSA